MAYGILPKPGTAYGPCPEPCEHRDCAETRRMVVEVCPHCGKPIDYETRFVQNKAGTLEHWACSLEAAERHMSIT